MFELRSKMKWYWPPGKWFDCPTPLPSGISWVSDPPTPLEFPIPSVVGVWIFSGTTHLGFVILFLCFVGGHLETRDLGLHIWWQWQGCGRLRESNQTWPLSIFFGLSWLSSDIWLGNKPFNSKIFLEFDLQRKCGKSFAKLMRARDSSWNQKTQDKVMRLGKSGKTWSPLNKRPFHIISSTTPAPNPPVGTIEFYLKKKRGILPIKVPTHLFI